MLYAMLSGFRMRALSLPSCVGKNIPERAAKKHYESNHFFMKKTLIALIALAGVAAAANEDVSLSLQLTSSSVQWKNDATGAAFNTLGVPSNTTLSDGSFTTNGTGRVGGRIGDTRNSCPAVGMDTFTLTFTADWTMNASGASMLVTWGEGGDWGFSFGIDDQGQWTVVQGAYNKSVTLHTSGVTAVDAGAQTYTIVGRTEGFTTATDGYGYVRPLGAYHIWAYEGENLVFSATYGSNTEGDMINFGQGYNPEIAFGGGMNNANATVMTVSAAKLNPASFVPEPATATLSLLALAGLAARRRRK